MSAPPHIELPAGLKLPSDADRARELIALELEQQAAEVRANELIARMEAERLESPVI